MRNKSWIIIVIMAIALAISLGYSIIVSQKSKSAGESTVTTTSIIEMKATTVTIKNTLTGTGTVEYKEKEMDSNSDANQVTELEPTTQEEVEKTFQITLAIEDKDLEKAKVGQEVEISIKKEEEILNYIGTVIKINEDTNHKFTLNVEVSNPDEKLEENITANCTVIIEKAENVVALPIEAIQKNEEGNDFVDVVQADGTTLPVEIKIGISDDYYAEITYGLELGDRVQIVKSTTTVVNQQNNNNVISQK